MRVYKRKTNRGRKSLDLYVSAAALVEDKKQSIRSAAKEYGLCHVTLNRFIKKRKIDPSAGVGYFSKKKMKEDIDNYHKYKLLGDIPVLKKHVIPRVPESSSPTPDETDTSLQVWEIVEMEDFTETSPTRLEASSNSSLGSNNAGPSGFGAPSSSYIIKQEIPIEEDFYDTNSIADDDQEASQELFEATEHDIKFEPEEIPDDVEEVDVKPNIKELNASTSKPPPKEASETEFDMFGRSIATQLNNMPLRDALKLQLAIQNVITEFRLGNFNT